MENFEENNNINNNDITIENDASTTTTVATDESNNDVLVADTKANNDTTINNDGSATANKPKVLQVSKASIIMSVIIILVLVVAAIVLAYTLPMGEYQKNEAGTEITGEYTAHPEWQRIAWWKVLLSPFLVLGDGNATTLIAILFLLIVIGAVFNALEKTGVLIYMVESIRCNYSDKRYTLLFLIPLGFMFLGTTSGMSEEVIPLVPIAVLLSYGLGWDALIGLGFSALAASLGFMAGVVNPFNVGIAQSLVGLPMFSGGLGLRIITFVLCYIILMAFMFTYAKLIDKKPSRSFVYKEDLIRKNEFDFENRVFVRDAGKDKALKFFAWCMVAIVAFAVLSIFLNGEYIKAFGDFALSDYILYITVVIYIIGGVVACIYSGLKGKELAKTMGKGALTLLPVTGMLLIVSGVRYIIDEGNVMDTILYYIINAAQGQSKALIIFIIYIVVIVFEMFITSGSAKAFLLMPLIGQMCSKLGIEMQVAVMAFAFADGIVNVFMPTNAGLLITLGLTTVTYPKWFKWAGPILLVVFGMTMGILMFGQYVMIF